MAGGYALDASALLCLIDDEPGAERVRAGLADCVISAVNYSEVAAKIVDRGGSLEMAVAILTPLHLDVVDFDSTQAIAAGALRAATRAAGLSFGDRACLSLALSTARVALTSDRAWAKLAHVGEVELVR